MRAYCREKAKKDWKIKRIGIALTSTIPWWKQREALALQAKKIFNLAITQNKLFKIFHCTIFNYTIAHLNSRVELVDTEKSMPNDKKTQNMHDECIHFSRVSMHASYHSKGMFTHKESEADNAFCRILSTLKRSIELSEKIKKATAHCTWIFYIEAIYFMVWSCHKHAVVILLTIMN